MNRLLAAAVAGAWLAGCFVVTESPDAAQRNEKDAGSRVEASPPGSAACGVTTTGMPASVEALLSARCQSCHGASPSSPMSLLTYEDLLAPAPSDASRSVAQLALARMESADAPMPPGAGISVTSEEVAAFRSWVDAGLPRSEGTGCTPDGGAAPDASGGGASTATRCSSGRTWDSEGNEDHRKGRRMNPGKACIACHERAEDDPVVILGGTVYPTLHEPDLCFGANETEARVVIVQADDSEITLPLTDTGNFSISAEDQDRLLFPIRARVEFDGRTREMQGAQDSADCNGCHTERGTNGAPGRIALP